MSSTRLFIFAKYSFIVDDPFVAVVSAMRILMVRALDCEAYIPSIVVHASFADWIVVGISLRISLNREFERSLFGFGN